MTRGTGTEQDSRVCPRCDLSLSAPPGEPTCNPLRSPDCWRIESKFNHDTRKWEPWPWAELARTEAVDA